MSVAAVGPDYASAWRTADERGFLDGLGTWSPMSDRSNGYRVDCLRKYLDSIDERAIKGSVDWSAVRDHAVGLLARAIQEAA